MSAVVFRKLSQAHEHLQNGEIDAAARLCEEVLRRAPRNPDALWLLATAKLMANRVNDAVPLLERAIAAAPQHGAALENLGLAHLMGGDYVAAERALRAAAALTGAPPSVRMRLGFALLHQDRAHEAAQEFESALALDVHNIDARLGLGRAHAAQGRWSDASREFERVLAASPRNVDALYNLGVAHEALGAIGRARVAFERCLEGAPEHLEARERHAAACLALGRYKQAAADLQHVAAARPSDARATLALAEAHFQCGAFDEAFAAGARARELDPSHAGAYNLMAQMHHVRGELDRAVQVLDDGYALTQSDTLLGALVHIAHRQCDWPRWEAAWARMSERLEDSASLGSPFWLLHERTTPQQQLTYTHRWVSENYGAVPSHAPTARKKQGRLRIGYFSGDFHQHPVASLLVQALELHDRSRFEVFAYSYGPDDRSALRTRLQRAVEHFVDVAWDPNDLVVDRIRSDALDLLVDLKGYTAGDRLRVMAQRPCPVQAAWLGYPATSGAPYIDYLIADPVLVPPAAEPHYSERVLRLPHCYQPNDRERATSQARPRADYGLPEDAVVFCCFNQTVKITPEVFARWMNLLRTVDGSVLWLLHDNPWATDNLRRSAIDAGIHPDRVIVAPRLAPAEHLARYAAADVALDTFPYTSHTTGSDALWMGCPLVALCGETFAARVSTSLLTSCGLPELVTQTLEDYENLARRLARDRPYLAEIRTRLAAARDTAPLFDTQRFTRDLEALYEGIVM